MPVAPAGSSGSGFLERQFQLSAHKTTVRTEILAGVTTFMTMAYILFVNPSVLGATGMDKGGILMATALASAFAGILMGFYANLPFALAPGMGVNAFFAFTVVAQMKIPWQTALGAVFIDGVIFLIISLLPIRERIFREIPYSIKLATSAAIGLFIAFIGLRSAGIVINFEATAVKMGDLTSPPVLLSVFGLLLTAWLIARRVKGGLLWGILVTTVLGFFVPNGQGGAVSNWPGFGGLVAMPQWEVFGQVAGQLDIAGALHIGLVMIVFTFTFVDMFDTAGTFVGLATKLGWINEQQQTFPRANRGLVVDSLGTMFGALVGTSTTTTYVESASGIAEGGRTGLTAVTTGGLFLAALFMAPLAGVVPAQATAPALIIVGYLMLEPLLKLKLDDATEAIPAFLTLIMMPLTYNIANGLIWGITSYVVLKLCTGRAREVGITTWVLAALFVISVIYHAT